MMKFELPADLAQALVNYLAHRPYVEVEGLIAALRTCNPIEQPVVSDDKP
jgi:hypothetical protein